MMPSNSFQFHLTFSVLYLQWCEGQHFNHAVNCQAAEILEENKIQTNGEYHLTDGIDLMIKKHEVKIEAITINNWFDLGKRDILLETNAVLLKK